MSGPVPEDGETISAALADDLGMTPDRRDREPSSDERQPAARAGRGWRDYASAPLRRAGAPGATAPDPGRDERARIAAEDRIDFAASMADRRR